MTLHNSKYITFNIPEIHCFVYLKDGVPRTRRIVREESPLTSPRLVDSVIVNPLVCCTVKVQKIPRPLGTLFSNRQMSPKIPKDKKIYNLHYDDVRGDVLWPTRGTTSAAVKIK